MEKYDTSQLTEFPRFEQESSQSGVSTFFNKLWKFPIFTGNEGENSQSKGTTDNKQESSQTEEQNRQECDDSTTETGAYAVELEGRSLPNVLKRISSLVALGSASGTKYADTELARYWMPDDISRECYECASRFSTLRRRHHCRVCGQIFCSRCCSQRVPGQIFGCAGGLRVCNYCCNVVLSYLRENDVTGDMSPDLKTLQENLQVKFPDNKIKPAAKNRENFMFARDQDDVKLAPKESMQDVFRRLSFALPTQQLRYRLVMYNGVWRGCDILQWIMNNTSLKTRAQANLLCQNLLCGGYMECTTDLPQFADYALYKPIVLPPCADQEDESPEEVPRLVESVSSYCLDLNLGENSARLIKTQKSDPKLTPSSEEENSTLEPIEETNKLCRALAEAGDDHLSLLLRQCLSRQNLSAAWIPVLQPLCQKAADIIMPDMYSNDIDIRNYVQVKKIPGDAARGSCLVPGPVLANNVAHRGMPQDIANPRVLLLDCSIAYQRVENKMTSLEPVLLQEQEYTTRMAQRIISLRPQLVLVRGSVSRGIQDELRRANVTLAVGVNERSLHRLSRCVAADRITSVDVRIASPRLGDCQRLRVHAFGDKTLMILEGCAKPNLGCSILLRGASIQELIRVKKVVKFMLLAYYNWKLEKSFLADIQASLPELGMNFDDDVEKNNDEKNEGSQKSEFNDPLQKKQYRKTDSDKNMSCTVPIRDFSDPLRSKMSVDEVFLPKEEKMKTDDSHIERWSTELALSISPNIAIPPAFLESEGGRKCLLRGYLRRVRGPGTPPAAPKVVHNTAVASDKNDRRAPHPFIINPLRAPADDAAVKASLAHYRASGCTSLDYRHNTDCHLHRPPILKKAQKQADRQTDAKDPFAPEQHQRLSVLLYSYSNKSANVPDFCVNPWIVTMEMYGQQDITIGAFLEKYCFNSEYPCPSSGCQLPMNQHVRKFVLGDICLTLTCNTVGHSKMDKENENQNKRIMLWSRCNVCGTSSRARPLSHTSLCLSLAQHIASMRSALLRTHCAHRINSHAISIVKGTTTASFRYSKIQTYDILLPPEMITTTYDTKVMRESLINQLNELMLKGHETFSNIPDSEAEREAFKQHMEPLHLLLTSTHLQEQPSAAAVVRSLWSVSDRITVGEKLLRDAQEKCPAPARGRQNAEASVEEKSDLEESSAETSNEHSDSINKEADKDHPATEDDEEKGDKKTVRQILSQLLSNNQPANQSGMLVCGGALPVLVTAREIGSVIAATLASAAYLRTLHHLHSTQSEQDDNETTSTNKDKTDGDKSKSAKCNDHIEVLLKDGLLCRVYYAPQFQKLRHMLLPSLASNPDVTDEFAGGSEPDTRCSCEHSKDKGDYKSVCDVEGGFIRSVCVSVAWAARGGKSGSSFCKTRDDRYVLKEMTKPEWQQFLEFAPHYFNYVTNCHQNKLPSLLARIVGVYSVGGAGNGILVMENIWYRCSANARRFDLKGASRTRLLPNEGDSVMLDHHLLHMRWESPLFIQSHTGMVLWSSVERDTAFLAAHGVMDYSLLLGVDGQALVLGIIDYIRTFTWDKKLEHLVKKNLGSGQPTVVSPEQYKRRFIDACKKYFPQCPAHWDNFYTSV